ncbi:MULTISPECIES: hypothetical protein [unclassified Marinomonas]|uniref:hypothetical protein n=1 Tax=unclassified Marinomonas TaxID=196814 RepID=UPI000B046E92|nr:MULTISPECIES: hypothetical protein [unclassified Marinomonas]
MSMMIESLADKPLVVVVMAITVILKLILDYFKSKSNSEKVEKAEKAAFDLSTSPLSSEISQLKDEHDTLKVATEQAKKVVEDHQNVLVMSRLFNLYSKQIEKYQQETRTRASWSFVFAIVSMFLGMGFIFWVGLSF